jgi:hypothetical protein
MPNNETPVGNSAPSEETEVQPNPDNKHPDYGSGIICSDFTVSGSYIYLPSQPDQQVNISVVVRVDVDRFFPQNRISIEVSSLAPNTTAHAIAEVTCNQIPLNNRRRITAMITYRDPDGDPALIQGEEVVFEATRNVEGAVVEYDYLLTLRGTGTIRSYPLKFLSPYFDKLDFEVTVVKGAGPAVTSYDTSSSSNRPEDLFSETISLETIFQRAGFKATQSSSEMEIPRDLANKNFKLAWSNSELNDAMSMFSSLVGKANCPSWDMWVLYADCHEENFCGVMFDLTYPQRQGSAIFTKSSLNVPPDGVKVEDEKVWIARNYFFTAVHEMGHAFNLAHSFQKADKDFEGLSGDPWDPNLLNQAEARSFMNYPWKVDGAEEKFFKSFRFRFLDDELIFMRHAPRRFVQMGYSSMFVDHGFKPPSALTQTGRWTLEIGTDRQILSMNVYNFLEPVILEFKLTNNSKSEQNIDNKLLDDGNHIIVFVQREGRQARKWRSMVTAIAEEKVTVLKQGQSIYTSYMISASAEGWLIDEPGFYKAQAALYMHDEILLSNVLRLYVAPPTTAEEIKYAPDYFVRDVGRALFFDGALSMDNVKKTLENIKTDCRDNPAARHAEVALSLYKLRDYKQIDWNGEMFSVKLSKANVKEGDRELKNIIDKNQDIAADTLGHFKYFKVRDHLVEAHRNIDQEIDQERANKLQKDTMDLMEKRGILLNYWKPAKEKSL